jgi:hypothetical protein
MMNEEQIHSSWGILIFMLAIHCVLYYFQLSLSWTLISLLAAFGCCMQFIYYTQFSEFIMLLWIYTILASRFATRFVTILGKKQGPKGNNYWRKTEIESSLDLILIWWKERELLQREGKKALWKNDNLGRERQNRALTYNQTRSRPVPRGSFLPAPHDAAPHVSTERSTKRESSRPSSFWGFQTRAWGKLSTTKNLRAQK